MIRRNEIFAIIALGITLGLLIIFSHKDGIVEHQRVRYGPELFDDNFDEQFFQNISTLTINDVVELEQIAVKDSLADYRFPPGMALENLTMATGGQPIRNVIITTWRSGSTFLGDVINAVPGNFYHYEPLLDYGIVQIRGPPYADSALRNLKNLLNCDYSNLQTYLEFGKMHIYLFTHNTRLWNLCETYPQYCWSSNFLSKVCKVYPFQSLKTVRLRLRLAERLLEDKSLNVKVLLLVRDPRGTLQSRRHRFWCPGQPDCDKPNLLCADMVSDYSAAINLKKLYPDRFRAIRYEDLSLDPYNYFQELFKFFGLHLHRDVYEFLDSHTKRDLGGVSSTFRDSKSAPFHWKMDLNFSEVQYIEENCDEAMKLWGYVKARDELHQKEFHPLINYTIN